MTRQAHWKRQHRRDVVLASLALGALMSAAPAFALADEQLDANSPVIDCFEYQVDNNYDAASLPNLDEMQAVDSAPTDADSTAGDNTSASTGQTNAEDSGTGARPEIEDDASGEQTNAPDNADNESPGISGSAGNGQSDASSDADSMKPDGSENASGEQPGSAGETDVEQPGNSNDSNSIADSEVGNTDKPGDSPQTGAAGTDEGDNGSQPETPAPDKPESNPPSQEPAVLTGWLNIGGYRYYYDNDGKPLTGLQTIEDKTYLFNEKGQLGYGFLYLGNNVVSYFDPITGSQLTGKQFIHGSWRNIDEQTGLNCGLTEVLESGKTNTYYYDNYDGGLHTGQQYVNNSWHFFDEETGRMYTRDEEVQRIVKFALAELGGSESTAFGYLKEVKADGGTYCGYGPCMATVRHIFKAAGMSGFLADGFVDSWPHKYLDLMIEKGQHTMTPRVGSVAFFRWENSFANQIGVSADHAEIVVEVGDGWYKTVGAIAGGIKESIYYTAGGYNIGFGVPAFHR